MISCKGLRHLRSSVSRQHKPASILLALAVSVTVMASPPNHDIRSSDSGTSAHSPHRWFQTGKATFYGRSFQGKRTATGERFDMNALTCAHPTLPFGSWLRVTNLRNRRSTFVRVNDRGPYTPGAIVDLSYAAAQRVGLIDVARVRVERVSPQDPEVTHALIAELSASDMPAISHR